MSNTTLALPQIALGTHFGTDGPIMLLESGASIFQSNLLSTSDLTISQPNIPFLNTIPITSPSINFTTDQPSSIMFCESPIDYSFCVDLNSLNKAMSNIGETLMTDQLVLAPGQSLSSSSCISFCSGKNADVIIYLF